MTSHRIEPLLSFVHGLRQSKVPMVGKSIVL